MLVGQVIHVFIVATFFLSYSEGLNKYSKEANLPKTEPVEGSNQTPWKDLEKPFRLAKINLIWAKAQKVPYILDKVYTS